MEQFFEEMIQNLSEYFQRVYKQPFTNQTVESCMGIYRLCKEENPDAVIEVGTNHGASTFALAVAIKNLGKELSIITSIDIDHDKWRESFKIHKDLLNKYDLSVKEIKIITGDFNNIYPNTVIDSNKRIFVFYDMHDHRGPWSQKLLDSWVPLVKKGVFCIHDINPVPEKFKLMEDKQSPRTMIRYKNGQYFAGFNECYRIIRWANENDIGIKVFPGGIYFKNG